MSRDGEQWQAGDITYTVNSTQDPNVPDGFYLSMTDQSTGEKATAVYNPDYTLADVKANSDWR